MCTRARSCLHGGQWGVGGKGQVREGGGGGDEGREKIGDSQ